MAIDECLKWAGAKNDKGYGYARVGGKQKRVHRLVAEHVFGPIPAGAVVMHSCDNPSCYRIEHLSIGTQKRNVEDMLEKGRDRMRGSANPRAKLSAEAVIEVRASREMGKVLAQRYGVSQACISEARTGKKWPS